MPGFRTDARDRIDDRSGIATHTPDNAGFAALSRNPSPRTSSPLDTRSQPCEAAAVLWRFRCYA